jgi:hypothetical protein
MNRSLRRTAFVLSGLAAATFGAACEQTKSDNPLSPLIAGPIAGVDITTPVLLEPETGRKYKPTQQPITLLIENPSSNSPRPFRLRVDISSDNQFSTIVLTHAGVEPGSNGRTAFQLPDALPAGRLYYWRVRAEDGANTGAYTSGRPFEVLEPVVIGAPSPRAPVGGGRITTRRPSLVVANATATGPFLPLTYFFEVATDAAFANRVVFEETGPGSLETSLTVPSDLAVDTLFFWRSRVTDTEVTGAWSEVESFRTPLAVTTPGPGPGPPPGNCALPDGPSIVACIEAKFPEYLVGGISLDQRHSNMEFLRDRVIEAGICGGLDLAWNKKRGDGPHSIDALAWRTPGGDEVVDIGLAFDDTGSELRLQWGIVGGPPGYDTYQPRPNCGTP